MITSMITIEYFAKQHVIVIILTITIRLQYGYLNKIRQKEYN